MVREKTSDPFSDAYPQKEAAEIAYLTVIEWLDKHELPEVVTFCCFSQLDEKFYRDLSALQ